MIKFPYGELYFDRMPPTIQNNVVIVHNNWILGRMKKIERFIKYDLWADGVKSYGQNGVKQERSKDYWNLKAKDVAHHDGIKVLGGEYLSTTCIKGQCFTPQEKDFKFDISRYFIHGGLHWKDC